MIETILWYTGCFFVWKYYDQLGELYWKLWEKCGKPDITPLFYGW